MAPKTGKLQGKIAKALIIPNRKTEIKPLLLHCPWCIEKGTLNLIILKEESPNKKNTLAKTKYVIGLTKNLPIKTPKIDEIIPKVVYIDATPRTKTKLIKKPLNLL